MLVSCEANLVLIYCTLENILNLLAFTKFIVWCVGTVHHNKLSLNCLLNFKRVVNVMKEWIVKSDAITFK